MLLTYIWFLGVAFYVDFIVIRGFAEDFKPVAFHTRRASSRAKVLSAVVVLVKTESILLW